MQAGIAIEAFARVDVVLWRPRELVRDSAEVDTACGGALAPNLFDTAAGLRCDCIATASGRGREREGKQQPTGNEGADRRTPSGVLRLSRCGLEAHERGLSQGLAKGQVLVHDAEPKMTEPSRPLAAMILAAGLGTRLRPLTDALPKPLVWIGNLPAISHVLSSIDVAAPSATVINSFYNASRLSEFVRDSGREVAISEETTLLGTAGGVARAFARNLFPAGSDLVIWNGDILSDLDVRALARVHGAESPLATLAVRARPKGEGSVGIDAEGRIVRLRTTSVSAEERGGDFLGISVISEACLSLLPGEGCLVGDAWIPALLRGETVRALVTTANTHDVGSIDAYARANFEWLARHANVMNAKDPANASYVAESAEVAGEVFRAIIGAGAEIGGSVRNSIVWPNTFDEGPLEDVIAGPGFRVPLPRR